ncbi:hypothetical protein JAAARDRAFT_140026 [Jaapia argillacea MUCL 33604]|uniref:Uncharacterized protein n=1 Tax=Jaapia argillacea MUCL 33604 TaxID=933084 RepID=A0A067PCG8_9AGAM|nr:hypothetical protein JAAARDRAFT_140026 [Jaapia argillacea MUCL 33604]
MSQSFYFPLFSWLCTVYRVHWLRAKAMRDQWREELVIVLREMDWVQHFFQHKLEEWSSWSWCSASTVSRAHLICLGTTTSMGCVHHFCSTGVRCYQDQSPSTVSDIP